jgi:hypothetical protein
MVNPYFGGRMDLRLTRVSGADAIDPESSRASRNVSFRSTIIELFVAAEIHLGSLLTGDSYARLDPYLLGGVGIFRFNPQAYYQGSYRDLQPLNTEGQGLTQYQDQKPYALTQLNVPVGGGLNWRLTDQITIGVEALAFLLFTDYLDDVSTIYITHPVLLESKGELTAALANRQGELLGTGPVIVATGSRRGNPEKNDSLATLSVSVSYRLDSFSLFSGKSGRYSGQCPRF